MKKLIALLLLSSLALSCLLASCGETESADGESELVSDGTESKPWYSTSTPDEYSNIIVDNSSANDNGESSVPEASAPEVSKPENEASAPEVSQGGSNIGYDSLNKLTGDVFKNAASGYHIAYTKTSALVASACVTNTNIAITAVYDGKVTRFFDALNGMYYHAVSGKYLYPCCEGTFLAGDLNGFNAKYSITFTREGEGVTFVTNDHSGHGIDYGYQAIYSEADKRVYFYDQELYAVELQAACRYYEGSALQGYNGDFAIDEAKLGKYGVASNTKIIIPFEYDLIVTAQTEGVGVYLAVKDGRCYYFSSNGKNLTPDGFDCGSQPFGDRAWVYEDGQGWIIKFN